MLKKSIREVQIFKIIEDLKSLDDTLDNPRVWSPDELKEACNNIAFKANFEVEPIENLTIQFLFKNLFFIMHQTGLYNPQRRFWTQLAYSKKIKIREYRKLNKKQRQENKVSDLILEDNHGKQIIVRLVYPGSKMENPGLENLLSSGSAKTHGLIYISDRLPTEKLLKKIRERTKFNDDSERYRSEINNHCNLAVVQYLPSKDGLAFSLVYPNLGKPDATRAFLKPSQLALFDGKPEAVLS